jgi:putative phosphoesterase
MEKKHKDRKKYSAGIISDTHGFLSPRVSSVFQGVDLIIHAGDIGSRSVLDGLRAIADVVAVKGNMDSGAWVRAMPMTEVARIGKNLVYVLHDLSRLDLDPSASGFLAVINGHTHRPLIEKHHGIFYINPGTAGSMSNRHTVAMLDIEADSVTARIIELN